MILTVWDDIFCIALFESEAIADSRGDECNQMVSVARQEINIIALNCISRARQRLATSEQEMGAQSQYGQVPECFLGRNPGLLITQRAYNKRPVPNAEVDWCRWDKDKRWALSGCVLVCVSFCVEVLLHVILIKSFKLLLLLWLNCTWPWRSDRYIWSNHPIPRCNAQRHQWSVRKTL